MAADAISALKEFLKENIPKSEYDNLVDNTEEDELHNFINDNFDVFTEEILRTIVKSALLARDENTNADGSAKVADSKIMGYWGIMIDAVRDVTATRQEQAGKIFKQLVDTARSEGPRATTSQLSRYYRSGKIDKLFCDLLAGAIEQCSGPENREQYQMFDFFRQVIERNKAVDIAKAAQNKAESDNKNTSSDSGGNGASTGVEASEASPLVVPPATSSSTENADKAVPPPAPSMPEKETEIKISTATATATASASGDDASASDAGGQTARLSEEEEKYQSKLVLASYYLKLVIDQSKGDASALQRRIQTDLWDGQEFSIEHFSKVVSDNLEASKTAGYVNRVKLLQFIESRAIEPIRQRLKDVGKGDDEGNEDPSLSGDTAYHAPKFMDDDMQTYEKVILSPKAFTEGYALQVEPKLSKTGKLLKPKVNPEQGLRDLAGKMAKHMDEHGWAVCDNFIRPDVVRRVRIEAGLFEEHYEQSEIWVGKNADVGTLLSVPSVRGDKVIWMCGGHDHRTAPEGVSRTVKTKGDIEPCRLEAKARAPMRKFAALKEAIKACDNLVDEMKLVCEPMSKIYSRSDAMLANYPGGGSRFARHIDNTTNDGRRITMLIYLNPEWDAETDQGALRLTPQDKDEGIDVYPECGRLAMFYSADMPHEVMPTFGDRHAITVWYYDSEERAEAVAQAQTSGAAEAAVNAGSDAQRTAKEFIADLMGGDEIDEDGGDPSKEELKALSNKVDDLDDVTLGVVASITGAPSTESFRAGFPMLTPTDLKQMRQLFRRMGLGKS